MKRHLFILLAYLPFLYSCSKSTPQPAQTTAPTTGTGTTPGTGTNTGTTPNPNAYVVKTIGISRIVVGADDNNNLTVATLYGGGNKVILKAGTGSGNKIEFLSAFAASEPDDVSAYPDGSVPNLDQAIDNGNPPYDTTGVYAAVFKIKGFDKTKTGYNQLNLVMCKYVWAKEVGWAGFQGNLTYLKMKKTAGTTNANYSVDFLKKLFSNNVSVTDVEIAVPRSENPYITEDQIVSFGQASYNSSIGQIVRADLTGPFYRSLFVTGSGYASNKPLTLKWFNATNGTVSKEDDYSFAAKFKNIKIGGLDQVVDPIDSVDKMYLRISGFDPSVFGFNQIRLFIANDSFYDGGFEIIYSTKQAAAPALSVFTDAFKAQGLNCYFMHPQWHHY